jgi:WXG100 family type VII secretion target
MSQSRFTTEIEQMTNTSQLTMAVNERVSAALQHTWMELNSVMEAWQGEASLSFQGLKDRWDQNAKTLNNTLRQIAEAIDKTKQQYVEAESMGRDDFRSITSNLQ